MSDKKSEISVGVIRGNNISNTTKPDVDLFKSLVKEGSKIEEAVKPALLISILDYPINIEYGDAVIRLSPRAKLKVGDYRKLPSKLPASVYLKKI